MFNQQQMEALFASHIRSDPELQDAIGAARQIADRVWVAGGVLYRNIVAGLYGTDVPEHTDIDLLVDSLKCPDELTGWHLESSLHPIHYHGRHQLVKQGKTIDLIPLDDRWIMPGTEELPPLAAYLATVPFTVQAMVYDPGKDKLIGYEGIDAIQRRTVGVHCASQLRRTAAAKESTPEKLLKEKAKSLDFKVV